MILNKDPLKESMRAVFLFTTIGPDQCFVLRFTGAKKKIVKLHGGKNKRKNFRVTQLAIISQNTTKLALSCFPLAALYSAPDLEKIV